MGSVARKMKRELNRKQNVDTFEFGKVAYDRGFTDGAKQQREADINQLVSFLEKLETLPGIGEKTANRVRKFFLDEFTKGD